MHEGRGIQDTMTLSVLHISDLHRDPANPIGNKILLESLERDRDHYTTKEDPQMTEYGEVMPKGRAGMRRDIPAALERVSERLPAMVIETLREQWARVAELDKEIGVIERRIKLWHRSNAASRKIAEIPGVGVLSATAVVAAMGDPAAFRSGREFAAWLGLVPRHSGTGGRVRMLGISKRGDRYLRTLLIHGARAVLTRSKTPPEWALRLAERRPANVVTVAIANKTARTIWALLAHDRAYQPNFVSQPA